MKIAKSTGLMLPLLMLTLYSFSQLKIRSGAAINLRDGVIMTISNLDLDNDGTLNPAAGAARILFRGTNDNTVFGTGVTGFDVLEIAKTGNGSLLLGRDIDIRSGIWFTSGYINLNNHVITLLGNTALNNESESSHIIGTSGGYVQSSMQLNNPQAVNPGNLGLIITSSQNLGFTTIRRRHQPLPVDANRVSIQRLFEIVPENNTALNATLRMHYLESEMKGFTESWLGIRTSDDLSTWTKRKSSENTAGNFVETSGVASLAHITLVDESVGLPVLFKLFNVQCRQGEVDLVWITAQEFNAKHFEVERSSNGTSWTSIATLPAAGISYSDKTYTYTDNQPGKFYRIKQVDLDGDFQYTAVAVANCDINSGWKVWPNPVKEKLFVSLQADRRSGATIQVFNGNGKLVKQQFVAVLPGSNQLSVDMQALPVGYYHVEVLLDSGAKKAVTVFKN